jgi:hypothetical protein
MNKRKIDFINEKFHIIKKDDLQKVYEEPTKKIIFRYLLNPNKIVDANNLSVSVTTMNGEAFQQEAIDT